MKEIENRMVWSGTVQDLVEREKDGGGFIDGLRKRERIGKKRRKVPMYVK